MMVGHISFVFGGLTSLNQLEAAAKVLYSDTRINEDTCIHVSVSATGCASKIAIVRCRIFIQELDYKESKEHGITFLTTSILVFPNKAA